MFLKNADNGVQWRKIGDCVKKFFITIFILLSFICPQQGAAGDISVEANVNIRKVVLDSFIRYTIQISGTQNAVPVTLPEIKGFQSRYLGPTRQTSFYNGQHMSSITFSYSLFPLETGTFEIPAVTVKVDGQDYVTEPISVEVVDSQSVSSSNGGAVGIQDKVFMALKIPKQHVYVNEKIPIKILFFVTNISIRDIQFPELKTVGIKVGEYDKPQQYQQVVNGVRYEIVEFNTVIYPTRTGQILVGPVTLQCNQLVQTSQGNSPFSSQRGFFDDSFFGSFFDSYEKRPLTIQSEEVVLDVLPLPKKSKPQGFSDGVGQFTFDMTASPKKVKVGDPITLRMRIGGEGNLEAVKFPKLEKGNQFKIYDPVIKEEEGEKVFEQVVIPKSSEIKEIPAISFSYFDTAFKQYKTIVKGPFPLEIEVENEGNRFKVVGLEQDEIRVKEPETLGQDIIFIKDDLGKLRRIGQVFYKSLLFYLGCVIFAGLFLASYIFYKRAHRLETDIVYARRLHAPKKARKGLAEVKHLMSSNKIEEFYDKLFKVFQQYLGNKFHLSSGAVTLSTIQQRLQDTKYQNVLGLIQSLFEECDTVRYASTQMKQEHMAESFKRLEQVIDYLERNV